jgi:diaminohydroxyphosphoribosylaminopyrimidine deaminase/5-amino-6-(5-phosphoribosylamino)uracil reductase
MDTDIRFMERALSLAAKGLGRTSPNPVVGCVIVRDGQIIGEGFHARAGEPHAEINAIQAAGGDIAGATIYLTLEPCTHYGKTPPCCDVLIEKRPARVVVAMEDPNPLVSGGGVALLEDAGIQVEVGLLEAEARRQNEWFIKFITTGRPFVIAKCAMSLDGKIATRTAHSQWVTGEAARREVHRLRNLVDGILVGSRTVMLDDPSLTTRLDEGETRDPVRIILDAGEYLDSGRRVFNSESTSPTWIAVTEERDYPGADEIIDVPKGRGGVDMAVLMQELGARGIMSLVIEGGGTTLASAFEAGIVDKVMFFVAPKIIGGRDAVTPVEGNGCDTLDEAVLLERMTAQPVGDDLLIEAYVKKS